MKMLNLWSKSVFLEKKWFELNSVANSLQFNYKLKIAQSYNWQVYADTIGKASGWFFFHIMNRSGKYKYSRKWFLKENSPKGKIKHPLLKI